MKITVATHADDKGIQVRLDIQDDPLEMATMERLLRQYRTIDAEIAKYERWSRGDGLLIEPSVTASLPREDDVAVLYELAAQTLTEAQETLVTVARRYVSGVTVATAVQGSQTLTASAYVTGERTARAIKGIAAETQDDQELLDMFRVMLEEGRELYVELTPTERVAIRREREIARAKDALPPLYARKRAMDEAMQVMRDYYPDDHALLWERYVLGRSVKEVCKQLGAGDTELTDKEYRNRRTRALSTLRKWLPEHMMSA